MHCDVQIRWTGQMGQMGSAAISMSLPCNGVLVVRYSTCTYQVPGRSGSVPASAPARAPDFTSGRQAGPAGCWLYSEWTGDVGMGW
jgi:hypothetical protein